MQDAEMRRDEAIRQLAYKIWLEEGCPDGWDLQHWLKAETTWLEDHRSTKKRNQSKARKGRKSKRSPTAEREL